MCLPKNVNVESAVHVLITFEVERLHVTENAACGQGNNTDETGELRFIISGRLPKLFVGCSCLLKGL